jgi:hypothetical protein
LHAVVVANGDPPIIFLLFLCKSLLESDSMALHRDIYWVGRQWAVTGFGVQAVDQRLKGAFDIEASQVWDDGLAARMRGHAWINAQDFDKALTMARQRFPEPAKKSLPLVESVQELVQQPAPSPSKEPLPPPASDAGVQRAEPSMEPPRPKPAPTAPPPTKPPPPFQLRMQGRLARFVPQWRVRR